MKNKILLIALLMTILTSLSVLGQVTLDNVTTTNTTNSISLSWETTGNYSRSVLVNTSNNATLYNNTAKQFTVTGLTNNTAYTYNLTVYALNNETDSELITVTTQQTQEINSLGRLIVSFFVGVFLLVIIMILFKSMYDKTPHLVLNNVVALGSMLIGGVILAGVLTEIIFALFGI